MPENDAYRRSSLALVGVFVAATVALAPMKMCGQQDLPEPRAGIALFPKAAGRVRQLIDTLNEESLETSTKRLGDVDMYFWLGPLGGRPVHSYEYPFPSTFADRDVDTIMSNRRVLKVFSELSALPEDDAASLVSEEMTSALAEYQRLFDDYVAENGKFFRPGTQVQSGPSFVTGNIGSDRPTLMGARFRVLALVFLAGKLKSEKLGLTVLHVAKVAREQYLRWSRSEEYLVFFNCDLLLRAGLYSRHVLGVGLIGTAGDAQQKNALLDRYKKRIQPHKLTRFDAMTTRYDTYGQIGAVQVDNTDGVTLWTISPLSDEEIEDIVEGRRRAISLQ